MVNLKDKFRLWLTRENEVNSRIAIFIKKLGISDETCSENARLIAQLMLRQNPLLAPDNLAKAATFVAISKCSNVSHDIIKKINQEGDRQDSSWISLIAVIKNSCKNELENNPGYRPTP